MAFFLPGISGVAIPARFPETGFVMRGNLQTFHPFGTFIEIPVRHHCSHLSLIHILFSGMDSGWKSAWEQMIETGKVSLSSFRSVFASFLADLMHMAITRPITVQIAGVVSGMLGTCLLYTS